MILKMTGGTHKVRYVDIFSDKVRTFYSGVHNVIICLKYRSKSPQISETIQKNVKISKFWTSLIIKMDSDTSMTGGPDVA